MQDWSEKMQANRVHYVSRCLERLVPMEQHVYQFSQTPWDADNLKQLSDHFHQVAGSSGVYGMGELTPIAEAGERLCRHMYENPPDDVIVYWRNFREMVAKMKSILEATLGESDVPLQQSNVGAEAYQSNPGLQASANLSYETENSAQEAGSPLAGSQSSGPPLTSSSTNIQIHEPSFEDDYAQAPASGPAVAQASHYATPAPHQISPGLAAAPATYSNPAGLQAIYDPMSMPQTAAASGPDVVVVSSDANSLNGMAAVLTREGMRVRKCPNWEAAREAVMNQFPDGILIFVPLQDGDGYDLIRGCRSLPAGDSASIILVSEEQGFLDKIGAIKSGADAFFELPVEVDVIVEKLRYLLEREKPERYRILSVEDDPDQADYIVTTLQNAGYHVLWQQDPKLFEEALLTFCPDLLLLDIMLGDITGFELARFVRQNERFAATPILFLTTLNQLEAHIESARAGGDDHLIKPVNPQLLVATVAGKLERYRIFQRLLRKDGLTQVLNHSHFMEYAQRSVAIRSHRFSQVLTVFNIDNLKAVNDAYGFAIGDRTIVSLVQMIRKTYRHTEIIGRISGDEVAILDDSLPVQDSIQVARNLLEKFAEVNHKAAGRVFNLTASAGVSHLDKEGTLQDLVTRAQGALQQAKQSGKNRVVRG